MKKFDFYQISSIFLGLAILGAVVFFIYNYFTGGFGRSAIQVEVMNGKASVSVNNKDYGDAPVYSEDILTSDIEVKIRGETNDYSTSIRPANSTLAIISRDLGVGEAFSSGQNIWMEKSFSQDEAQISVVSPLVEGVSVIVDGVEIGKTPTKFATKDLLKENENNRYILTFRKDGYEEQQVAVTAVPGYQLNIRVDLFLIPIPKEYSSLDGLPEGVKFLNFSKVSNPGFMDKKSWAKGINYWIKTREANVFGNFKIDRFNYFISDNGEIYDGDGNQINPTEMKAEGDTAIVYLGYEDKMQLTDQAKESINQALNGEVSITENDGTAPAGAGFKIKIQPTGLGFLRVRDNGATSGKEVGRVNEGLEFDVLEEKSGWYKIKYEGEKEGWVSGSYAKKVE